jgi:hypothetical protein
MNGLQRNLPQPRSESVEQIKSSHGLQLCSDELRLTQWPSLGSSHKTIGMLLTLREDKHLEPSCSNSRDAASLTRNVCRLAVSFSCLSSGITIIIVSQTKLIRKPIMASWHPNSCFPYSCGILTCSKIQSAFKGNTNIGRIVLEVLLQATRKGVVRMV